MKNSTIEKTLGFLTKTLAVCLSLALPSAFMPVVARAANNMDIQSSALGGLAMFATRLGGTVAGAGNNTAVSTTTVIMNLSYSGTAASANVTIGASSITFYAPQGTVDTTIGSATYGATGGTFDLSVSSVATLGQLCDLINGVQGPFALSGNANGGAPSGGNYHCVLVDGVRSDASTSFLPNVLQAANVNRLNAVGGYSVPTSTAQLVSLGILPANGRHVVLNACWVNSSGTPPVQVFGVPAKFGIGATSLDQFGNTLTDAYLAYVSPALTANTTQLLPNFVAGSTGVQPNTPWIEFGGGGSYSYALNVPPGHAPSGPVGNAYNGHVVVRVNNYGLNAANEASTNFIGCDWTEK